ncbi:flagellar hook-length control protein FliK [Kurthia massiliensis]|uniref:flagellar hook-length control protein FliK n=1 Tax=Kurthia massiliensis TaxID=1033739 RepID=UPI000289D7E3|nr:flagellar hook-length control protein FliK [Kurthia massiliensis]
MNIATLQLASAGQQPLSTAQGGQSGQTTSFAETLNAASTQTATNTVDETVDTTATPTDGEASKGLQLELGLSALLGKPQTAQDATDIDVTEVLNATSLADLGVEVTDVDLATGTQPLTLDAIAETLNIDVDTLTKTLSDLIGEEVTGDQLFDVLNQIDQNVQTFVQNLSNALAGKGDVSKSAAHDVTKLLKFIEIAAPKTDLALKQEMQVSQLKDWMSSIASRVTETSQTSKDVKNMLKQSPVQIQISNTDIATQPTKMAAQTTSIVTKPVVATSMANVTEVEAPSASSEPLGNATAKVVPQTTTVTFKLPQSTPASQAASFVEKFEQVMSRSQMANNAQGQRLLIKLYPEQLGSVRIEFMQKDGVMSARILTSTAAGKQMIEGQLNQLKSGLANQNIQLDRIDISQALSEPGRSEQRGQQFNQQHSAHQQANERQEQQEEEEFSFEELLAELEV